MAVNHDAPQHGGNLQQAVAHYGIPRSDWLDLSTGISPWSWPVPLLPEEVWQRLPEQDGELEQAAQAYYGAPALPIPGSQWAIQQLPGLFARTRVWLAQESYEEYRYWWQQRGHTLQTFTTTPAAADLRPGDIVVVINPNNPTGRLHTTAELQQLAAQLQRINGWLIVDEAFMDTTPEDSLLPSVQPEPNIIVLRSLGKFFGLAGIRAGFVFGNANIRTTLQQHLGPWAISHPAQRIATQALADTHWHTLQRQRLQQASERLQALLLGHFPAQALTATPLFVSVQPGANRAAYWQNALARHGIWIRLFPQWNRLRLGVTDAAGLQRLAEALAQIEP